MNPAIIRIFSDALGMPENEITSDSTDNDLGMDSLDKAEIVMELEEEFGVKIRDTEFDRLKQVSDYENLVNEKLTQSLNV